ncbi:MAG: peptide deformylase [Acidimicrobiia bacterium]|nr:peptide deformylase [Acidimicrobiia bacterium]
MATFSIRTFGDPVLKTPTTEVTELDDALVRLVEAMIQTMYEAPGVGLAAPQVGVQKRLFVYDIGDGPNVVINPVLSDFRDEWTYHEGCLSVPELWWDITRAKQVHLSGIDLDGNELDIEADELLARVFQHEVDHLDGVLLLERVSADERKDAMRALRQRALGLPGDRAVPNNTAEAPR